MKKFLSILLALALVLSLGTVAFAVEDGNSYEDIQDVNPRITETYQVNNGTAPAEIFTYKFTPVSWTDNNGDAGEVSEMPAIANVKIEFDSSKTSVTKDEEVPINVNNYDLGVYTYEVTESVGNTAGVTYSNEKLYLVLSVVRDENSNKHFVAALHKGSATGDKTETGLINEYDSGSLTVTKQIEGNMADMNKKFTFTITFDAADKNWVNAIESNNTSGTWSENKLVYTVQLGDGESVTLSNIPAGLTYTVDENEDGYVKTSDFSDKDEVKTIAANDEDTATFTNTLTQAIDTGVFMDSLPYVLLLVGACAGLVVFFARRRMTHKG